MGCETSVTQDDVNELYAQIKEIYHSDYCKIYLGRNKKNGEEIAIKEIDKIILFQNKNESELKEIKELISKEFENIKLLKDNPNFVRYIDFFEKSDHYYLIMEMCDQDLSTYMKTNKNLGKDEIFLILNGINKCLTKMDELKIIHKDLQPQNILLKYDKTLGENVAKIGSLGLLHSIEMLTPLKKNNILNQKGVIAYTAPELLESTSNPGNINMVANLWSIGVLIYQLALGEYPLGDNFTQISVKLKKDIKLQKTGDKDLDDLISKLLKKDPFERMYFDEYIKHRFWIEKDESVTFIGKFNEKFKTKIKSDDEKISITTFNIGDEGLKLLGKIRFKNLTELNLSVLFCTSSTCITSIKPIINEKYKNLLKLNLAYNKINDLNLLSNAQCFDLSELYLAHNQIQDINFLKDAPFDKLRILELNDNQIKDMSVLEYVSFGALEKLNLESNNIQAIDPLRNAPFRHLKYLSIGKNEIKDFDDFSHPPFKNLEELYLSESNLDDVGFLSRVSLNSLKILYLDRNKIENIDIISHLSCYDLEELNLSYNQIENLNVFIFSDVKFISSLQILDISNNKINNVQVLKRNRFSNLKKLYLGNNELNYEARENVTLFDLLINKGVELILQSYD